mmetsp:Transcript_19281/g.46568  ORF Transcript_19281/g.46568 Transcript_19281/m.46568 type:complete len:208 (+) Transcript_19281:152-775(+)|eukprot:CAMPEP_0113452846 /NCGR_PEP_ID=MMETSP0014_2-20120614/7055_1 /TAXON_ID=2857 /ORGANISM="Nitzschia sp." /LENGTH=207 /DNA_ID=CAMNT_0000344227 /DNA_START=179 /DNA_END=802 /DNA_ORIENTATION=+ /assembly_acc=CAM_ASM_000159
MKYSITATAAAVVAVVSGFNDVQAWTSPSQPQQQQQTTTTNNSNMMSRKSMLQTLVQGTTAAAVTVAFMPQATFAAAATETLPSGVSYEVVKAGTGPKPDIGELVAIRFAAYYGDRKIDDIFDTPEPYYTRLGSGGLLKGVEQTLPLMKVGDRWKLTVPSTLAFGPKGRPASAGKPRIPGDAEITFEVEMVGLPGKEPELIDLIGDD